jgi:hypothetical protein
MKIIYFNSILRTILKTCLKIIQLFKLEISIKYAKKNTSINIISKLYVQIQIETH